MEENYKQFQRVTDRLITYLRFRDNERKQGEDEVWEKIEKGLVSKKVFSLKRRIYMGITAVAAVVIFWTNMLHYWRSLFWIAPRFKSIYLLRIK